MQLFFSNFNFFNMYNFFNWLNIWSLSSLFTQLNYLFLSDWLITDKHCLSIGFNLFLLIKMGNMWFLFTY